MPEPEFVGRGRAGADAVDRDLRCESQRQRFGQCSQSALGGGVVAKLRLADIRLLGGYVDDRWPPGGAECRKSRLCDEKRRAQMQVSAASQLSSVTSSTD